VVIFCSQKGYESKQFCETPPYSDTGTQKSISHLLPNLIQHLMLANHRFGTTTKNSLTHTAVTTYISTDVTKERSKMECLLVSLLQSLRIYRSCCLTNYIYH